MITKCDTCGNDYYVRPSRYARSTRHYCSKACTITGSDVPCTNCGALVHREPKQLEALEKPFCNRECQSAYYDKLASVSCTVCNKELHRNKSERNESGIYYCSNECRSKHGNRYTEVDCCICNTKFEKATADLERYPNHCCSIDCRSKFNDKRISIKCEECQKTFIRPPSKMDGKEKLFCSVICHDKNQDTKIDMQCAKCGKDFRVSPCYSTNNLSEQYFCSSDCSSRYYHQENYTEAMFSKMLDEADIKHIRNDRTILSGLELDIWMPDLRIGVEINGPSHYKPIFGEESLAAQRARDKRKREMCKQLGIKLRVVKPANCRNGVMQRRFEAVIREITRQ